MDRHLAAMHLMMDSWTRYPSLVSALDAGAAAELEEYCLLGRIGNFEAAEALWTGKLHRNASTFLYAISYLDVVLRQSRYGTASDFLESFERQGEQSVTEAQQKSVLAVLRAFLDLFTRGWLRVALAQARVTLRWLSQTAQEYYDDYHIHATEICMHILKFAQNQSTYTSTEDLSFPSQRKGEPQQAWIGYDAWALKLAQENRYWEAINVVKILSSTMPSSWSIGVYGRIGEAMSGKDLSVQGRLSRLALFLALGMRYALACQVEQATHSVQEATRLLTQFEQEIHKTCSRQRLEQELANLELLPVYTNVSVSLREWHHAAKIAQGRQEWGIEASCLTRCAQIAGMNRMVDALKGYSERLYVVENDLERDMMSVFSNKCGLWQAGNRSSLGDLLRWFEDHDKEYPMSDFSSESASEEQLWQWDIPWSIARVAQLRYLMYSALQDPERASSAKRMTEKAVAFVPFGRLSELGLLDRYMLEWANPLTGESVSPFEVLIRRIRNHYSVASTNDGSDWYRFRELEQVELQNIILSLPFDQERFMRKIRSLSHWFAKDDSLDGRSSDYLIGRLYLEHYAYAKSTGQLQDVKERVVTTFSDFVSNMPQSSQDVQRQLYANVLLAWQEQYDSMLGRPFQPIQGLEVLRSRYQDLIAKYESSHLSKNLPVIGSLHGRVAEIDFRLAFSEPQLERAMDALNNSLRYYNDYRASLSSLPALEALEIKGYSRQSIVGEQEVLQRVTSALMSKWLSNTQKAIKQKISAFVWEIVQNNKNRALGDALNAAATLSASDRAVLEENPASRKRYEDWRAAVENLSLATQDRTCQAERLTQLRETLKEEELRMSADPFCAKVIAFSKGMPTSMAEMGHLFPDSKERIILVDWFTANIPDIANKLFMITLVVAPSVQSPTIFQLEQNIGPKVLNWTEKYIQGKAAFKNRQSQGAREELNGLAGLVQPLAMVSQPNDILVFCPTTKWLLHRVPLHAIELRGVPADKGSGVTSSENLLLLRNRIVYTYSQSLLRLSIITRQADASSKATWNATVLSPLGAAPDTLNMDDPANQASREISRRIGDLATFLDPSNSSSAVLNATSVTKSASIQAMLNASFLTFLGHVHTAPQAIKSHILLYHPHPEAGCKPENETDAETFLTGEDIVNRARLQTGAHAILLACGSGVTDARVQDEVLGLVPAFFHAGARSVLATLWDIEREIACEWVQAVQQAWESAERDLKTYEKANKATPWGKMLDLAEIFRTAAKTLMKRPEAVGIDSWAPLVYNGYWMYPRVDVDVFDGDEE